MKVGHVFKIDEIEYCICDIINVNDKIYAYAISGEGESTSFTFFELKYDDEGVLIDEVIDANVKAELLMLFSKN